MKTMLRWPLGMALAHEQHGASCGHFALAAALGVDLPEVLGFLPDGQSWCSVRTMEDALRRTGKLWRCQGEIRQGIMLVQGLGSWMGAGVPFAARLARTHWVAVAPSDEGSGSMIADANGTHWVPIETWEQTILKTILAKWKATGWEIKAAYTI